MIRINSYIHREKFRDLVSRWMHDRPAPTDGRLVTELVHFNSAYISRYLDGFAQRIFSHLYGEDLWVVRARQKGELKDSIIRNAPAAGARVEELVKIYREKPERFYRETPFHGTLFFTRKNGEGRYVGSSRIKRVRRLAEKSARRIIDYVFANIKRHADELAEQRARRMGMRREQLITDRAEMVREFMRAEQELIDDLRRDRPLPFDGELVINDVAGLKVILENGERNRLLDWISGQRDCRIIEHEVHTGHYNATNLIVQFNPSPEETLARPLGERLLAVLARRGLDPAGAQQQFERFVREGEGQVNIEIIVCNYLEMLESEIGRCIHEDRIIEQRMQQQYRGPLAKNVEYLMVYLFNLAVSPRVEFQGLPLKLWCRYLPDMVDDLLRSLFDLPSLGLLEDS